MWKILLDILKKASKYGAVAFTGYEIEDKLSSNGQQTMPQTNYTSLKKLQ